jgi:hypothetical protein
MIEGLVFGLEDKKFGAQLPGNSDGKLESLFIAFKCEENILENCGIGFFLRERLDRMDGGNHSASFLQRIQVS